MLLGAIKRMVPDMIYPPFNTFPYNSLNIPNLTLLLFNPNESGKFPILLPHVRYVALYAQ